MKKPKYVLAVDHTASSAKDFSHFALESTVKEFAFAEAAIKAMKVEDVFCYHVLERKKNGNYRTMGVIYPQSAQGFRWVRKDEGWFLFNLDEPNW